MMRRRRLLLKGAAAFCLLSISPFGFCGVIVMIVAARITTGIQLYPCDY